MGKIAQQNLQFFHTANKKEFLVLLEIFSKLYVFKLLTGHSAVSGWAEVSVQNQKTTVHLVFKELSGHHIPNIFSMYPNPVLTPVLKS